MTKSMPSPGPRTALSGYVLAMAHAMAESGVDYRSLMEGIGMDYRHLEDFGYRFCQEQVTRLWKAAVEATGDQNFGLKVAKHIRPSSYHVVGHAMLCSDSLRSATRRFARFAKLVSDSAVVRFVEKDDHCRLEIELETGGELPRYQAFDTVLAGFLEYCRWIAHDPLDPVEVLFTHSAPAAPEEYQALFRCPIHYEREVNALVFLPSEMDRPIP